AGGASVPSATTLASAIFIPAPLRSTPLISAVSPALTSPDFRSPNLASSCLVSSGLKASIGLGAAGAGGPIIDLAISDDPAAEIVAVVAAPALVTIEVFVAPGADANASVLAASVRDLSAAEMTVVVTGAGTGGWAVAAVCCGAWAVPAGMFE